MADESEHAWELNRENIRPLRTGRKVKSINAVFGGAEVTINEAEKRFNDEFALAEMSENPLDICMRYIGWFEEHFPTGKQTHLFSMLTRIINTFGYREEFLNDERMLKFWIKLTENKSNMNVETFFERAYLAGCCRRLANFYIRWAEIREIAHDISGARTVLRRGRENCAEPINLLNEASDALEMRQLRAIKNLPDSDKDNTDDVEMNMQRLALGQLTGLGPNCEAPVIRDAFRRTGRLHFDTQQVCGALRRSENEKTRNAFHIYQDDEILSEENLLVPKSYGDELAHVAFVQNSWDPTKWKDARIDGIPKRSKVNPAAFTVFNEQAMEEQKQQKIRLRLLVVNKITSMEELFAESFQL